MCPINVYHYIRHIPDVIRWQHLKCMTNFYSNFYDFMVRKYYKKHKKNEFIEKMKNEKKEKKKDKKNNLKLLANTFENKIVMDTEDDIIEYLFDKVKDLVYYEKPRFKLYKEEETDNKEIIKLQKTTMINANGDLNVLFKNLFPEISLTLINDKKMKIYYYKSGDNFNFNNSCLKKLYLKLKKYHTEEIETQLLK